MLKKYSDYRLILLFVLGYCILHIPYISMHPWSLSSWREYTYLQAAAYADEGLLNNTMQKLRMLPPLVSVEAIQQLQSILAQAARGEAFVILGGDCAESFQDCTAPIVAKKVAMLQQMSAMIAQDLKQPVFCIGRIAGQYAKPRSYDFETQGDITLPSYRGDLVNTPTFSASAREPNPLLLLQAYHSSATTLDCITSLTQDFFTAHEALHLPYEEALTREHHGHWYNFSTHLPWIGMRTAQIGSAHVELLRGVRNPIGLKVGPNITADTLSALLATLNPQREPGRMVLFTRLGADKTSSLLPGLIQAVQQSKNPVAWFCDPMHGNTETTPDGVKTRHFDNILSELRQTAAIHQQHNNILCGIHLELTAGNVTECIGGSQGLEVGDLKTAYHSLVDPRLNYQQSLEITKLLGLMIGRAKPLHRLDENSQMLRRHIRRDTVA